MEVSVRDAAARMGVSPQRIRSLARGGRIPARKIGRDWAIEIDQLIIAPGERYDVVADFSYAPMGTEFFLRNFGGDEPFSGHRV